ncbi:MAG: phage major tail tube protein [Kluyvera sp.]|uniref:phage major tail tube protein n=1 Tax=Kluyvera sp. TaxID=1538228 RepID=UPI003A8638B1
MAEKNIIWRNQAVALNNTIYVGRISKGGMTIERKTTTLSSLGGVGDVAVPNGKFNASTATLEFNSLSTADARQLCQNDGYVKLRLTGQARVVDSASGTRVVNNAVTQIYGWVTNPPVNLFNNDEPYTANISVLFVSVSDQQGRVFEVDFENGTSYPEDTPSTGVSFTI